MPSFDPTSGLPLVAPSGTPADGCGCCEIIPCCKTLCGVTPLWIDAQLDTGGFADWFNAIPLSLAYRDDSRTVGAFTSYTEYQCLLDFATTVRCRYVGNCIWRGEVAVGAGFKYRTQRVGFDSGWVNITGSLVVEAWVEKISDFTRVAHLYAYFRPEAGQDPVGKLYFDEGIAPSSFVCCGCGPASIFKGEYFDCPITLREFASNRVKAYNKAGVLSGTLSDCPEVGSAAPGSVIPFYGNASGCTRTDCTGDCGYDHDECATIEELLECLSCVGFPGDHNIVISADTNTGTSKFDFFTFGGPVTELIVDDPPDEFPDVIGFANNSWGSTGNVWWALTCLGLNRDTGRMRWEFSLSASENGDTVRDYEVLAYIEGEVGSKCPPTAFAITEDNAYSWDVPDGVTTINTSIACT